MLLPTFVVHSMGILSGFPHQPRYRRITLEVEGRNQVTVRPDVMIVIYNVGDAILMPNYHDNATQILKKRITFCIVLKLNKICDLHFPGANEIHYLVSSSLYDIQLTIETRMRISILQ